MEVALKSWCYSLQRFLFEIGNGLDASGFVRVFIIIPGFLKLSWGWMSHNLVNLTSIQQAWSLWRVPRPISMTENHLFSSVWKVNSVSFIQWCRNSLWALRLTSKPLCSFFVLLGPDLCFKAHKWRQASFLTWDCISILCQEGPLKQYNGLAHSGRALSRLQRWVQSSVVYIVVRPHRGRICLYSVRFVALFLMLSETQRSHWAQQSSVNE